MIEAIDLSSLFLDMRILNDCDIEIFTAALIAMANTSVECQFWVIDCNFRIFALGLSWIIQMLLMLPKWLWGGFWVANQEMLCLW